jgi:hypothetical protein
MGVPHVGSAGNRVGITIRPMNRILKRRGYRSGYNLM